MKVPIFLCKWTTHQLLQPLAKWGAQGVLGSGQRNTQDVELNYFKE